MWAALITAFRSHAVAAACGNEKTARLSDQLKWFRWASRMRAVIVRPWVCA